MREKVSKSRAGLAADSLREILREEFLRPVNLSQSELAHKIRAILRRINQ